jgi:hypothetical protein
VILGDTRSAVTREIVAVELTSDDVGDMSDISIRLDQIDADVASR